MSVEISVPSILEVTKKSDVGTLHGSPLLADQEHIEESLSWVLTLTVACKMNLSDRSPSYEVRSVPALMTGTLAYLAAKAAEPTLGCLNTITSA